MNEMSVADLDVVGVEHEYRVLDPAGAPVDFRQLLPKLNVPGAGLDPADPNAHHLPSGILLTADGKEAEVATPPVPVAPGSSRAVSAWSERAEAELLRVLPVGHAIEGFSTHLNIAVRGDVVAVAQRFARHFGVATMVLTDHRDSPGLLVRPRRGRLELGIDFLEGEQLRTALTFALGAARRCESDTDLPPPTEGRLARAKDRPGWFIDHHAVARDVAGARVRLRDAWTTAQTALVDVTDVRERSAVAGAVDGRVPIPLESLSGPDGMEVPLDSPFADVAAAPFPIAAMSWAAVAFRTAPDVHVIVPRRSLRAYLAQPDIEGLRVIRGAFDPVCVIPEEPHVPGPWWREHRPELVGAVAGVVSVAALYVAFAR